MCGGVRRALELVEKHGSGKLYVLNEIVHNNFIVENLKKRGIVTVHHLNDVPENATVVFSAHGVSRAVEKLAAERCLNVIDATCPLVKKLHKAVAESVNAGEFTVLLGHAGHPEVEGIIGQAEAGLVHLIESAEEVESLPELPEDKKVRFLTQTTLDMEQLDSAFRALKSRYGERLQSDSGVCYATRDRQNAVKELAEKTELIIVIGSPRSSNSNRLREVAESSGCPAILIDRAKDLDLSMLQNISAVGITAGASAPEELMEELTALLKKHGFVPGK